MKTLHILNKADCATLQQLLSLLTPEDSLILIANGVYACADKAVIALAKTLPVYALQDDIDSRGLQARCPSHFKRCDYSAFVELCREHSNSVSW